MKRGHLYPDLIFVEGDKVSIGGVLYLPAFVTVGRFLCVGELGQIVDTALATCDFPSSSGASSLSATITEYMPYVGVLGPTATAGNADMRWGKGRNVVRFYVSLTSAPGAGKSRTVVLQVSGNDTAVTVTISGTSTSAVWTGLLNVAESSLVRIKCVPTNTPAASPVRMSLGMEVKEA